MDQQVTIELGLTEQQCRKFLLMPTQKEKFDKKLLNMGLRCHIMEVNPGKGQVIFHLHRDSAQDIEPIQLVYFGIFIGYIVE